MMGAITEKAETSGAVDPNDSEFALSDGWAERLTKIGKEIHETEMSGDHNPDVKDEFVERFHDEFLATKTVAEGSGRMVVELPDEAFADPLANERHDYVVKFPKTHGTDGWGGREQNRVEAENWETDASELLMPVTMYEPNGWWLIMPCGECRYPKGDHDTDAWKDAVSERHGGTTVDEEDIRSANIVELMGDIDEDDDLKLCDYGVREV